LYCAQCQRENPAESEALYIVSALWVLLCRANDNIREDTLIEFIVLRSKVCSCNYAPSAPQTSPSYITPTSSTAPLLIYEFLARRQSRDRQRYCLIGQLNRSPWPATCLLNQLSPRRNGRCRRADDRISYLASRETMERPSGLQLALLPPNWQIMKVY